MTQDDGWDYPSGSEVVTICGEDDDRAPVPALGPALGASYTRGAGRHIDPIRVLVWALTLVLAVCVVGFALVGWGRSAAQTQTVVSNVTTYPLHVVFGDQGTSGSGSVCTDETLDLQSGGWSCKGWAANTAGLPIEQATPEDGTCTERQVDESVGRWVCVN